MRRANATLDSWLLKGSSGRQTAPQTQNVPPSGLFPIQKDLKSQVDPAVLYSPGRTARNENEDGKPLVSDGKPVLSQAKVSSRLKSGKVSKTRSAPKSQDPDLRPLDVIPKDYQIPSSCLGDLLYITDFSWTFSDLLKTPEFSVLALYQSLMTPGPTPLLCDLTVALVREAAKSVVLREDEDTVSESMPHLQLFRHIREHLDLDLLATTVPFLLLSELLESPTIHLEDSDFFSFYRLEGNPRLVPMVDFSFYTDFPLREKVAVFLVLINAVFDSPALREILTNRMEEKAAIHQEKHELEGQLRVFNKEHRGEHASKGSEIWEQKQEKKRRIQALREQEESIPLRTEPVGTDRDGNAYFLFEFDQGLIFVQENCSSGSQWRGIDSLETRSALQHVLKDIFPGEKSISDAIRRVSEAEKPGNPHEMPMDLDPPTDPEAGMRGNCIDFLLKIEAKLTTFYSATGKYWASDAEIREWRGDVTSAGSPERFKAVLCHFSEQANVPYKRFPDQSVKRVNLRLWAAYSEATEVWDRLWTRAVSWEHVFALVSVVSAVFEDYFHSKRKSFLTATAKAAKAVGSTGVRTRRLTRLSEKLRVQELLADETHDDFCCICEEGGDLLCCDACPKVAHAHCVGLTVTSIQHVPDGQWFCSACIRLRPSSRSRGFLI